MTEDFSKRLEGFEAVWKRVQGEKNQNGTSPAKPVPYTQKAPVQKPMAQRKNQQGQNRRRNNQRPGGRW